MATYPTPYGGCRINIQNCNFKEVYYEINRTYPIAGDNVGLEYLVTEANRLRPEQVTEIARPHHMGQFLDKFQRYTCDLLFTGPTSDIVRDTVTIQNDMGGSSVLVYYDWEQKPNYDLVFKNSNGTNYASWQDYNLKIYSKIYDDPLAGWTLKQSVNGYDSRIIKTGDGTIPAEDSYKSFLVEMVQVKRYGRCYGITDGFGQTVIAATDGSHAMDANETLLFTSTIYGVQNLTVGEAAGLTVTIYTRDKQTANTWNQYDQILSYAGQTFSMDFQKFDVKVSVTGGGSL